jgi:hypothetical protein
MHIGGIIKMLDQIFWQAYGKLLTGRMLKQDITKQRSDEL